MSKVPELAKQFIPFTNTEKAAALISLGTVMMQWNISGAAAMSNAHDDRRVQVMMQNGVDGARAAHLVNEDPAALTCA